MHITHDIITTKELKLSNFKNVCVRERQRQKETETERLD